MKVLVLGATGFIGGQVSRALVERGYTVRALRRAQSPLLAVEDLPLEFVRGDMHDRPSLLAAMQGVEAVFHAAAYYPPHSLTPRRSMSRAVAGMRSVLDCAREAGVGRIVYTSSLSTIGPATGDRKLADERDAYLPGSVGNSYFEAKWAMESEIYRAVAAGQDIVVLCPTAVFGPGDVKPTTGSMLVALARGLMPVYVDGQTNVVDGRDLAGVQVAALERGRTGERYVVGGHNTTVAEVIRLATDTLGIAPPRMRLPSTLALVAGKAVEAGALALPSKPLLPLSETIEMIRHGQHYNCSKAEHELALSARPLKDTLRDTLQWFREHGYLKS